MTKIGVDTMPYSHKNMAKEEFFKVSVMWYLIYI
jgi:hypothetical protein